MIKTFLKQLGGATAVAERLTKLAGETVKKGSVHQWPYENRIPDKWKPYLLVMARDKNVALPDELKPLADLQKREVSAQPLPTSPTDAATNEAA